MIVKISVIVTMVLIMMLMLSEIKGVGCNFSCNLSVNPSGILTNRS